MDHRDALLSFSFPKSVKLPLWGTAFVSGYDLLCLLSVNTKGKNTSSRGCKRCEFEPPTTLSGSRTNKQRRFGKKQNKQLSRTPQPPARPHAARFKRRSLHTPHRCASVNNCEVAFARINTPIDSPLSTQPRSQSQPRTCSRPTEHLPAA
jgi:hypothetical protein